MFFAVQTNQMFRGVLCPHPERHVGDIYIPCQDCGFGSEKNFLEAKAAQPQQHLENPAPSFRDDDK